MKIRLNKTARKYLKITRKSPQIARSKCENPPQIACSKCENKPQIARSKCENPNSQNPHEVISKIRKIPKIYRKSAVKTLL